MRVGFAPNVVFLSLDVASVVTAVGCERIPCAEDAGTLSFMESVQTLEL